MPQPVKNLVGNEHEIDLMTRLAQHDPDFAPFYQRLLAQGLLALNIGAERWLHEQREERIMMWRCYLDGDVKAVRVYLAKIEQAAIRQKAIDAVLKSPVRRTTEMRLAG